MSTEILLLIATLAIIFYVWQKRTYNYWQRLGVRHIKPSPIFGNMRNFLTAKMSFFEQLSVFHNAPGYEKEPLVGIYLLHRPALLVKDLELVKNVMIKKFSYFVNRSLQADPIHDPLGYNNLFFVRNPEWKELRNKISPVFTSGKMKQMYTLMVEIGKDLETHVNAIADNSVINIKNVNSRFTTDLIATTAFGVKANSLSDENSEFFDYNKKIFEVNWSRGIDTSTIFMFPSLVSLVRAKLFSKDTSNFMRRSLTYVLKEREKSGARRNDLIDILVSLKKEAIGHPENKANNLDYLVAQAAVFQTAGFETSSSTMTMTLFELSHYPEVQERLRKEIIEYFGDEDHIDYERIQEMPYLTMVVNETLRKYPIVGYAERECNQPENGERFTLAPHYDLEVPHGMPVYVSTVSIQRDPRYWPEPDKYDPERFAPENRDKLVMDAYMPFGVGPRNCIGMRLGLLQTKLGLVHLLRNHRVVKCDETINSITFAPFSIVMTSKQEILVKLQKA